MMREQIEMKLLAAFSPVHLNIVDESYRHNVPEGSESHFKVILVSNAFAGLRLIGRHRQVYGILQDELATSVHALALHTYTPDEWVELEDKQRASPACRGAGIAG